LNEPFARVDALKVLRAELASLFADAAGPRFRAMAVSLTPADGRERFQPVRGDHSVIRLFGVL
jgi:hypothetical protein